MHSKHTAYLTRQDDNTRHCRYYSVRIDPDLFGRWSLIRQWGRLDYHGGVLRIDSFESETLALGRLSRIVARQKQRGYLEWQADRGTLT